jgi:hypothetical protein
MAKLNRERRLRERRIEKQVKKDLRKRAAAEDANRQDDPVPGEEQSQPGSAG